MLSNSINVVRLRQRQFVLLFVPWKPILIKNDGNEHAFYKPHVRCPAGQKSVRTHPPTRRHCKRQNRGLISNTRGAGTGDRDERIWGKLWHDDNAMLTCWAQGIVDKSEVWRLLPCGWGITFPIQYILASPWLYSELSVIMAISRNTTVIIIIIRNTTTITFVFA